MGYGVVKGTGVTAGGRGWTAGGTAWVGVGRTDEGWSGGRRVREARPDYGDGTTHEARALEPVEPVGDLGCVGDGEPGWNPKQVDDLGDEIAVLSAHIESATQRLLLLIARFDEVRGWERAGHSSCAHWLAHRTGIDLGAARERVRAARALTELPLLRGALARGELTFSKVRALTRVATPDTEAYLLEVARPATAAQLERFVRGWKMGGAADEAEREEIRHAARHFSVFPDLDGSYVVKGRLTPEVGALLMRAIEAAGDVLYRQEWAEREEGGKRGDGAKRGAARRPGDSEVAAARRRADALALLAEWALAVQGGQAPESQGGRAPELQDGQAPDLQDGGGREDHDHRPRGGPHGCLRRALRGSAETRGGAGHPSTIKPLPLSGSRAQRYQVMVHVDMNTLQGDESGNWSHVEDVRGSAETSRRLTCDAALVPVRSAGSQPLDLGRRTRTIPPALRRALEARDRGCRFPGCGSRFTDAHHIRHWARGGETSLENCILLCRHHHRLVHEGGWSVALWGKGRPVFHDPRGGTHFDGRWKAPELGPEPVATLLAENLRALGGETGHTRRTP